MKKFTLIYLLLISNISLAESIQTNNEKYIIFARHGKTDYNVKKLLTGRGSNPDLNEEGIKQALELGKKLAQDFSEDLQIELIVSSDMKRTNKTSNLVNTHLSVPLIYNRELQEVDRGGLEGKPLDEVIPIINSIPENQSHPIYGGESTEAFRNRIIENICKYYYAPEKVILLVAHGYAGEIAHHYFKNENIQLGNSDYIIFTSRDLENKCSPHKKV